MSNESTAGSISTFINSIWEAAVLVAREGQIVAPLSTVFNDRQGLASRYFSQYSGGTIQTITESTDMSAQTFTPGTAAVLTPSQVGLQYFITDLRIESDPFGTRADASRDLGEVVSTSVDTNLVGLFSSFTGGTVGTAGGTLTWANFLASINVLRAAKAPQPYTFVCAPGQWYYLANAIAAGQTVTNTPALQDAVARQYFVANAYGVDIYVDANITSGTAAVAGMFNRQAIGLDIRRPFRLEYQRDASRGGGGWELNSTMVYAYGVWRAGFGVKMVGTSTVS